MYAIRLGLCVAYVRKFELESGLDLNWIRKWTWNRESAQIYTACILYVCMWVCKMELRG